MLTAVGCTDSKQDSIALQKNVYARSLEIGDLNSAIYSAQQLLTLQPDSLMYYDTLAELYYKAEDYVPAFNITEMAMNNSHNSVRLTQIRGYSATKVERYEDAVVSFQDLVELDEENKLEYTYQLGLAFYWLKNYDSAIKYMTAVANNKESRYENVTLYAKNSSQKVPYYLSALNIIGYCFMQRQEFDKAEEVYKTALKEDPNFQLAANNYQLLLQLKQQMKEQE